MGSNGLGPVVVANGGVPAVTEGPLGIILCEVEALSDGMISLGLPGG